MVRAGAHRCRPYDLPRLPDDRAFLDGWDYEIGPYLSPVFEPKLHGTYDAWCFSPALLILWVPIGFRATCYYYRRAYYRSYLFSPPACAVGDLPAATCADGEYSGEGKFPLVLQNLHRFFMYGALVFTVFLWYGALKLVLQHRSRDRRHEAETGWGIGVGSIVLCLNAALLMMYTFSCHSFRHLVGGGLDCFSLQRLQPHPQAPLGPRERLEHEPPPLRLDEPGLDRLHGRLHPARRQRSHHRPNTWGLLAWLSTRQHEYDVIVVGAGGRRAARGDRGVGAGREDGARLQVAAGQGAHGDGRRRHRGGAGQRLLRGQLAGALPRHDARRQDAEQLAHGPAPRAGSARPRLRAGGVGRAVRPHEGRPHPAARLRRAQVRPPGARRRPHRPGDDPHAAAARRAQGHRRLHGVHGLAPAEGRRPHLRRRGLLARERQAAAVQGEGGRAGHGRHRQGVQDHLELLGVHRRRALAGLLGRRGADRHGVRAVPPDGHGLAAQRARHPRHRGRARRGRHAEEHRRQALHVRLHHRTTSAPRPPTPRKRPTSGSATRPRTAARPTCCRATRWPARSTPR